jgi:hypothetical protein
MARGGGLTKAHRWPAGPWRRISGVASILAYAAVLCACDDGERERATKQATEARERAEAGLMADTLRAGSELERRLRMRITYRDGVLIVSDDFDINLYALPAKFGAGTSAEQDNSGFTLDLTRANLERDQCKSLAPIVAQKVLAIAKGN